jgi:hypothetical protein
VLSSSALSIRGHKIGSLTSQIMYDVPQINDGLIGHITVDAKPILGSSVAISSNSALQWDLHRDNAGLMSLASDATSTSGNQTSQPKPLWSLSSTCEYDGGSFQAAASETVSNSLVDSTGQYKLDSLRNWYVLLSTNLSCAYIFNFFHFILLL